MDDRLENLKNNGLKILVCPLNWGLGHATRCMPIIDTLLIRGHQVHLACDGKAAKLLIEEYPNLKFHYLADLDIQYNKFFFLKLMIQVPLIIHWAKKDHEKLKIIVKETNYDLIISDSRPGIIAKNITSVFIINQPRPILPWYFGRYGIRNALIKLFHRYHELWIPDLNQNDNLSGELIQLPKDVRRKYLGLLSRMQINDFQKNTGYKILAIVSGPEPSRTEFQNKLIARLEDENAFIVGGNPTSTFNDTKFISFLPPDALSKLIQSSEVMVSRGGYSSLMDLAPFGKKLVLVPTPGQTEQAYLAKRLVDRNQALVWNMDKESWSVINKRLESIEPFYLANDPSLLQNAIMEIEDYIREKH